MVGFGTVMALGLAVAPVRRVDSYDFLRGELKSYGSYQEPVRRAETRNVSPWSVLNDQGAPEFDAHKSEAVGKVFELRRLSGLPVKQLAELVGVSPKTIHNWQNGSVISASNLARLGKVLDALRYADRGEARLNKAMLLTEGNGRGVAFDLLKNEHFSEFRELAGQGLGRVGSKKFSMVGKPLETVGEHLASLAEGDHSKELTEVRNFKKTDFDLTDDDWT